MRTRRNASPAAIPNAPIDLTSLLDVIFILLFIVILAYSKASQDLRLKQEELEQNAAAASQENASQSIHSDLIDQYTAEIAAGTEEGKIIQALIDKGNLAPAEIRKAGTSFDLSIAIGILNNLKKLKDNSQVIY